MYIVSADAPMRTEHCLVSQALVEVPAVGIKMRPERAERSPPFLQDLTFMTRTWASIAGYVRFVVVPIEKGDLSQRSIALRHFSSRQLQLAQQSPQTRTPPTQPCHSVPGKRSQVQAGRHSSELRRRRRLWQGRDAT
ncbi:hypothetical protein H257_03676 [Aphanomyces astaci]|uniref:Uncharacterized protein n=1 Tax=Aphanomyces astaci TaxID=112090 RepID=W4GZN1_APHAT|nr:hypothetical protein H257_03676 [Aphanomyces astaci]ETV84479.1 hypothetical protein H257_03676 [Aphanomyces astaci]|eukprot:XP_009826171.1 hypothetical protein H257_03676 [Aphanomyces astaci]